MTKTKAGMTQAAITRAARDLPTAPDVLITYVEAMNGLLQQAKRAARGFRTGKNFIAIAYLRLSKLTHLPAHPFAAALAR